jgi:hypothetical protein
MSFVGSASGRKCYYWSRDAAAAIGQCVRYLDVLHDQASSVQMMRDHPEMVAWHPRAIVVIGRTGDWSDAQHRDLRALNNRLHGVTVMTYDHLLAQGDRLVEILDG